MVKKKKAIHLFPSFRSCLVFLIWVSFVYVIIFLGLNLQFELDGPGNEFIALLEIPIIALLLTWPWFGFYTNLGQEIITNSALPRSSRYVIRLFTWNLIWPGLPFLMGILLTIFAIKLNEIYLLVLLYIFLLAYFFIGRCLDFVPFSLQYERKSFLTSVRSVLIFDKHYLASTLPLHFLFFFGGFIFLVVSTLIALVCLITLLFVVQSIIIDIKFLAVIFRILLIIIVSIVVSVIATYRGMVLYKLKLKRPRKISQYELIIGYTSFLSLIMIVTSPSLFLLGERTFPEVFIPNSPIYCLFFFLAGVSLIFLLLNGVSKLIFIIQEQNYSADRRIVLNI